MPGSQAHVPTTATWTHCSQVARPHRKVLSDPTEESYWRGHWEDSGNGLREAMKAHAGQRQQKSSPSLRLSASGEGVDKGTQRGGQELWPLHTDEAILPHATQQGKRENKHLPPLLPLSQQCAGPTCGGIMPEIRRQRWPLTPMTEINLPGHWDKGRERTRRSQQEMSSLLAVSLPLQKTLLQLRQSQLSRSLPGGQEDR